MLLRRQAPGVACISARDPTCVLCRLLPYGACDWHQREFDAPVSGVTANTEVGHGAASIASVLVETEAAAPSRSSGRSPR